MNYRILLCLVTSTLLSVLFSCNPQPHHPQLSGHRGAPYIAPENTLASVDSCILYGIEFVECDVQVSKDSVFYLLHDRTLDRTTNGTGLFAEWNSEDIDTLDAGSWFGPEFAGLRVPRLEEVLQKAKEGGVKLTIDYRTGDLKQMLDLIEKHDMLANCTFVYSQEKDYWEFRELAPTCNTMQAYVQGPASLEQAIEKFQPNVAVVRMDSINKEMVDYLHKRDIKILGLSLHREDPMESDYIKAQQLGVDIIATDRPAFYAKRRK